MGPVPASDPAFKVLLGFLGTVPAFLGKEPQNIGHIKLAQKRGLGTYDFSKLVQKKVSV